MRAAISKHTSALHTLSPSLHTLSFSSSIFLCVQTHTGQLRSHWFWVGTHACGFRTWPHSFLSTMLPTYAIYAGNCYFRKSLLASFKVEQIQLHKKQQALWMDKNGWNEIKESI